MNEQGKQTTTINLQVPTAENLAGRRTLIPVSFTLVVIFFFFTFVDFKCNGTTAASLKGINLVTGTQLETSMGNALNGAQNYLDQADDYLGSGSSKQKSTAYDDDKVPPNFWAILAFLSAIGGAVIFWKKHPRETLIGIAAGAVGFISLIILHSVITGKVDEQGGGMVKIETDFQFAYWMSLLCFIVAGSISYLRLRYKSNTVAGSPEQQVNKLNVFISSSHDTNKKST